MASGANTTLRSGLPSTLVITLVPLAVAVNYVGTTAVALLHLPVYLDTIGTFLAAVVLGPWWGALVGVMSNGIGAWGANDAGFMLFAPVSVAAALLWGYGIRSLGLGRHAVPFFLLAAVVGVVTGVLATPVALVVYGGATGHASDLITAAFSAVGLERAVLVSSVLSSVPDKVVSAYAGLLVTAALPAAVAARAVLPGRPGGRRMAVAVVGVAVGVALAIAVVLLQPPAA